MNSTITSSSKLMLFTSIVSFYQLLYEENPLRLEDFVSIEQRRLYHNTIPRASLTDPTRSPWIQLYHSNIQQSMIAFTGFDYATFHYLLDKIETIYYFLKHFKLLVNLPTRS
jgi:hypothetical protein